MAAGRKSELLCGALGLFLAVPAFGALGGSATISGVANGPNYDYTIVLTNTDAPGGAGINTFWFAWTPPAHPIEYDFLPSSPTVTSSPAGWVGLASAGFPGNSIDYYSVGGSAIGPGQQGTFKFSSPDSPATLQGLAFGFFPITDSFIYSTSVTPFGTPPDTAVEVRPTFVAAAPEPASLGVLGVGCAGLLLRRRRVKG